MMIPRESKTHGTARSMAAGKSSARRGAGDDPATRHMLRRHDLVAPFYDLLEVPIERMLYASWREHLWSNVRRQAGWTIENVTSLTGNGIFRMIEASKPH